jgi:hypothetical protein
MQPLTDLEAGRRTRSARGPGRRFDQHRVAVVRAEARRVARILQPFGVLHKDALKRRARAANWHEGSFDGALRTAVAMGEIERLPLDFYRKSHHPGDPSSAGSTRDAA